MKSLRSDFRASPVDSNFFSAEIVVNGESYFGVAPGKAGVDQPFSFEVGGIHRGSITARSRECQFDETKSYSNSSRVKFLVSKTNKRCLFSIFINPQFTEKEANKQSWRGVQGLLVFRQSNMAIVEAAQLRRGAYHIFNVEIKRPSRIYLKGCDTSYSSHHGPSRVAIELDSTDMDEKACVIDGFIKDDLGGTTDVVILISRFKDEFSRLPEPVIQHSNGSFKFSADRAVSIATFGNQLKFSPEGQFAGNGVLKLFTAQGRSAFCIIKDGEHKCFH